MESEFKLSRKELEFLHQGLRRVIDEEYALGRGEGSALEPVKDLALRLHSFKSSYDTDLKLGVKKAD